MLEQPQPPTVKQNNNTEVEGLREEIRRLRSDMDFLRRLLEHLQEEFTRIRK